MAARKKVLVPGAAPPAAQKVNKGRTTSMQRRGIGAGQVPGQAPPTRRGGPVTPAVAAQNFIQGRKFASPAPTRTPPTPDGGAQAVLPTPAPVQPMEMSAPGTTAVARAPAPTPTIQPAPKPVTV
jgi:hypothetical protein